MSTTDFESWLDQIEPDGTEEIYALYETVSNEDSYGIFEVSKNGNQLIIKSGCGSDILIASKKAKLLFLEIIRERYMSNTDDAECWYGFQRNMDNPKA